MSEGKEHGYIDQGRCRAPIFPSLILECGMLTQYFCCLCRCRKNIVPLLASGHDQTDDGDCQSDAPKGVQAKLAYRKLPPFAVHGNVIEKLSKIAVNVKAGDHKESLRIM